MITAPQVPRGFFVNLRGRSSILQGEGGWQPLCGLLWASPKLQIAPCFYRSAFLVSVQKTRGGLLNANRSFLLHWGDPWRKLQASPTLQEPASSSPPCRRSPALNLPDPIGGPSAPPRRLKSPWVPAVLRRHWTTPLKWEWSSKGFQCSAEIVVLTSLTLAYHVKNVKIQVCQRSCYLLDLHAWNGFPLKCFPLYQLFIEESLCICSILKGSYYFTILIFPAVQIIVLTSPFLKA